MTESNNIEEFIKAIMNSGLPEERIKYWLDKIEAEDISEADEAEFKKEFSDHLNNLDEAIAVAEVEKEEAQKIVDKNEADALPYLEQIQDKQEDYNKEEMAAYKKELEDGESEMMNKLEGVRGASEESEMEKIRKSLGNKPKS